MSESKFETLSSLVDDNLSSIDLSKGNKPIDGILKDEELAESWQNYHLIGDVLRDETPQSLQLDLSSQIAQAIADEATILSPNSASNTSSIDEDVANDDVKQPSPIIQAQHRFKAKVQQLIKPVGQVAIAASAAVLMVVGVQQNVAEDAVITPNQIVQPMPLGGYANPVSFNYLSPEQGEQSATLPSSKSVINKPATSEELSPKEKLEQKIAQQRRLQALINDHHQQVKIK